MSDFNSIPNLWNSKDTPETWHRLWHERFSPARAHVTLMGTRMAILDGKPVLLDDLAKEAFLNSRWPSTSVFQGKTAFVAGLTLMERVREAYRLTDREIETGNCFTRLFVNVREYTSKSAPRFCIETEADGTVFNAMNRPILAKLNEGLSVTLDMVKSIEISEPCAESRPCKHWMKITLKDGREATGEINGFDAYYLLRALVGFIPVSDNSKKHFAAYATASFPPNCGWSPRSAKDIENILSRKFEILTDRLRADGPSLKC